MTKAELRKTAQTALKNEYGFAPSVSKIVLLEANGEGSYILFMVNCKEYRFTTRYGIEKTGYDYNKEEA